MQDFASKAISDGFNYFPLFSDVELVMTDLTIL